MFLKTLAFIATGLEKKKTANKLYLHYKYTLSDPTGYVPQTLALTLVIAAKPWLNPFLPGSYKLPPLIALETNEETVGIDLSVEPLKKSIFECGM